MRCWQNLQFLQNSQGVIEFPGTPSFKREHLPSVFLRYRESDPDSEFVRESFISNAATWGVIFNTFRELEGPSLDHIRAELGHPTVFAVGPLGSNRVESDRGVAVRVCEGADSVPDPNELGRVVSVAMSGGSSEKRRAKLMSEEAVRAVSEGGESCKEVDELLKVLLDLGAKQGKFMLYDYFLQLQL